MIEELFEIHHFRKGVKEVDRNGKEVLYDFENKINMSVFPGLQVPIFFLLIHILSKLSEYVFLFYLNATRPERKMIIV